MKTIEQLASILKLANIRDNYQSIISEAMDNIMQVMKTS